jgi:hypothetical protein
LTPGAVTWNGPRFLLDTPALHAPGLQIGADMVAPSPAPTTPSEVRMVGVSRSTLGLAALLPAALGAQVPTPAPPTTKHPASFEDLLFPPELVMQYLRELNLTAQRTPSPRRSRPCSRRGGSQWQMRDGKLHELLGNTVEEAAVLAQVDKVLGSRASSGCTW